MNDRAKLTHKALLLSLMFYCGASSASLTLQEAEQAALEQAPELKASDLKSSAIEQTSVASGQLSDPKLSIGAMNLPVDTFSVSQEPMTQLRVGVFQDFPRGKTLKYRSMQQRLLSQAQSQKTEILTLDILRQLRLSWLELYYWYQYKTITRQQIKIFKDLIRVTESLLANNKAQQKDVIRAQLELTTLEDKLITADQEIETAQANLSRWIGYELSKQVQPTTLPSWQKPQQRTNLLNLIDSHPELETDQALISAKHAEIDVAKQQYKPGFSVGLAYGFRQGTNRDTTTRPDFLTAAVNIELPLFTHNRQDRTLNARVKEHEAQKEIRMSRYRQLKEMANKNFSVWQQQGKSVKLYQEKLIPEATQYAQATLSAYQNAQTDFPTLARAYVRELDTKLAGLNANINHTKARIILLYIEGR